MSSVPHTGALVQHVVDSLERSYAEAVTLRKLAREIGRHPAYVGEVFRRETGLTVRAYLTRTRMRHAARLIADGLKVEAVAMVVGYRGKASFYRQFKRHFGTTPTEYRKRFPAVAERDG